MLKRQRLSSGSLSDQKSETKTTSNLINNENKANANPNNYEIETNKIMLAHEINGGSFSKIFLGLFDKKLVAIKKMNVSENSSHKHVAEQEKNMLAEIKNKNIPNVINYYGYAYSNSTTLLLVLEYYPKGSIGDVIQKTVDCPFSFDLLLRFSKEIATALKVLHENNIVHHDIKADNILINDTHHAILCDFGLTKTVTPDAEKKMTGTITHLAPEIISLKPFTTKADIFAYAAFLVEMYNWSFLFEGIKDYDVLKLVKSGQREKIADSCPPNIAHLITLGWSQKPDDRPSAAEMLEGLNKEEPPTLPKLT